MFSALTVDMANGRAFATLECGLSANGGNSALVADAWAAAKPLWGDLPAVRVVVTDDSGTPTVLTTQTFKQNNRYWWKLPAGSSDVTFEWDKTQVANPAVVLSGYVIGK